MKQLERPEPLGERTRGMGKSSASASNLRSAVAGNLVADDAGGDPVATSTSGSPPSAAAGWREWIEPLGHIEAAIGGETLEEGGAKRSGGARPRVLMKCMTRPSVPSKHPAALSQP